MAYMITPEQERQFIIDILDKEGINEADAGKVADVLVAADLRGIKSHGLSRLERYVTRINLGLIERYHALTEVTRNTNSVLLDGNNSLGQISGVEAMELAINLAKEHGSGIVSTGNSNHFGIAAYYSMMASKEGLIGFVCTNTSPLMAPFGGKEAVLGTNPFTVAVPAGKYDDIVLDLATSQVARGKIEVAAREGQDIPIGWALDKEGRPTTDAHEGLAGTVTPVGGPKGYGMALIVDILSGVLTRSAFLDDIGSLSREDAKQNLGFFMAVIDPEVFMPREQFTQTIDQYIERVKASAKAEGVEEIFLPGEIEANVTKVNAEKGIKVLEGLYHSLSAFAEKYDINVNDYITKQ